MPLTVRIGPNRDPRSLQKCPVNNDTSPIAVSSEHFEGLVTVRVQNHHPSSLSSPSSPSAPISSSLASDSPSSPPSSSSSTFASCPYFDQKTRLFSLQWQGQFKATNPARPDGLWTGDDVLFVAEAEKAVKVPRGTSLVTRFVRLIDPAFVADAIWNKRRPWVGSPLVSGMNILRVWKASDTDHQDHGSDSGHDQNQDPDHDYDDDTLQPKTDRLRKDWIYYGLNRLEEDNVDLLFKSPDKNVLSSKDQPTGEYLAKETITAEPSAKSWWWSQTSDQSKQIPSIALTRGKRKKSGMTALTVAGLTPYQRRRFFTKQEHRQAALLDPSLVIAGDFFNNFTDFEHAQGRMVITIHFDQVLQGQPMRFVCKSRAKRDKSKGAVNHSKENLDEPSSGAVVLESQGEKEQTEEDAAVFFVVELQWTP
ncbi:hypothetical protein EMPS_10714 [Entomortierella parvispora]|uniref:Domain of unknown function at the cortex 1 domain-containing protein n=1 Tax=Entomortierella parvispora TaxID=205924 RepID=A0A9P3M1T2_9FUNG|nr:hypothetical protein EMPS_10714 [Entomortierella parvispora]